MVYINRRKFLTTAAATTMASGSGLLAKLANQRAFAADTQGYKALVCVMLRGGSDHADTILPRDPQSYAALEAVRGGIMGSHGASHDRENLVPLAPANAARFSGREFGMPSYFAPLGALYDAGELAIVSDVGPLIEPVTRQTYESGAAALPQHLFSHNDQQSTWQSLGVEGTRIGWGGQFADAAIASDPTSTAEFAAISMTSPSVFLFGNAATPFRAPLGDRTPDISIVHKNYFLGNADRFDATRDAIQAYLQSTDPTNPNLYARDLKAMQAAGVDATLLFRAARQGTVAVEHAFPNPSLSLDRVADIIAMRNVLNVNRQVFFVRHGFYDTHGSQAREIADLHGELVPALAAFRDAMVAQGDWDNVTLFTMSEFGRALVENGSGTDHGWGGHAMVMGGAVRGGDIYGEIAPPEPLSQSYVDRRGRLIPTTSIEQFAATLGRWFGLDEGELIRVLPNLVNFDAQDLGFMATGQP
ncbi:MAG: DUF1501 domain-containing protein [Pseudomonadota bacterium]